MIVKKSIIDDFLEPYSLQSKYLVSANENYPILNGEFSIKQSCYLRDYLSSGHLNIVDLLICYNQLAFVGIANALENKKIIELNISYDLFKENMLHGLICRVDNLKFGKQINAESFSGQISIDKIISNNSNYFIKTYFNFENKIKGEILLATKINNLK